MLLLRALKPFWIGRGDTHQHVRPGQIFLVFPHALNRPFGGAWWVEGKFVVTGFSIDWLTSRGFVEEER